MFFEGFNLTNVDVAGGSLSREEAPEAVTAELLRFFS